MGWEGVSHLDDECLALQTALPAGFQQLTRRKDGAPAGGGVPAVAAVKLHRLHPHME